MDVVEEFHRRFYTAATWTTLTWMGVRTLKYPNDLLVYQEILHEITPELIVECGTYAGGTALFLAHMCDILGHGKVLSIDAAPAEPLPQHRRIRYLRGPSTSPEIAREVRAATCSALSVLVILDSDHSCHHVLRELRLYAPLVSIGSYCIVEDTIMNGNPVLPGSGPGPNGAVDQFLRENHDFEVDRWRERFLVTANPGGYLRRTRSTDRQPDVISSAWTTFSVP